MPGTRQQAARGCCDSPVSDVRSRCYPPAGQIKVGTGGNKLATSHRIDNFPGWKLKYELKNIAHVTAENSLVCVTKGGHVSTLSIKEKKEIEEIKEGYR